jgi:3-oxoacyl-[acyl-carrier protein] reductase
MGVFQDQVVLVTGAGHLRGRSIAQAFAIHGAIIAANDLTPINLDETIHQITAAGGRAKEYIFDVAKKMPVQALLEQVLEDWGRLDICIHCAQVKPKAALLDMDEWDWRRTVDVNLSSAFFILQSAGRIMRQQGSGHIVSIINVPDEKLDQTGYAALQASKTGMVGLLLSAAKELGEHRIWITGVTAGEMGSAIRQALPDLVIDSATDSNSTAGLGEAVLAICKAPPEDVHGKFLLIAD